MIETTASTALEQKPTKSRHLSILDFIETLQLEYICADLRHKIYPKLKDKAYWQRVRDGKRATIEKLSEKNNLPSIFTDETMLRIFEQKVYRPVSYPLFNYKDEANKQAQEYYDHLYYYSKGAEVRVDLDGEVLVGKISGDYIPFNMAVMVMIDGKATGYPTKIVTRIL